MKIMNNSLCDDLSRLHVMKATNGERQHKATKTIIKGENSKKAE
jgi:hypothetical protein